MIIYEFLHWIFSDYTLSTVAMGAMILGMVSGCLGSFAVLRQQSLLGDAIAHATLPGVALAFLITQNKSPLVLLLGAGLSGWLGTLFIMAITQQTKIKRDAALGIILSVFFGAGLMLLTIVQKMPTATKAGLDKFLFGNAATLLRDDIWLMSVLAGLVLVTIFLFWKEFKVMVFDYDFAKSLGIKVHFFDVLLTTLIVVGIVIGLQMVGVVLMSAMLVAPAVAARQWTDRLGVMVVIAVIFGVIAGVLGAVTSSLMAHMPTGPTIVVFLSVLVFGSVFFAPHRGMLWDGLRALKQKQEIQMTTMLHNIFLLAQSHQDPCHPHDMAALRAVGKAGFQRTLEQLLRKGWVQKFSNHRWALTPQGLDEIKELRQKYGGEENV